MGSSHSPGAKQFFKSEKLRERQINIEEKNWNKQKLLEARRMNEIKKGQQQRLNMDYRKKNIEEKNKNSHIKDRERQLRQATRRLNNLMKKQ